MNTSVVHQTRAPYTCSKSTRISKNKTKRSKIRNLLLQDFLEHLDILVANGVSLNLESRIATAKPQS